MKMRKVLAFLLIAVQAAAMAVMTGRFAFPLAIAALAVAVLVSRLQFTLAPKRMFFGGILIVIIFLLKWRIAPLGAVGGSELPMFSLGMDYQLAHALAQGLLACQVAMLLSRHERGLPAYLPGLAAAALVLVGNIPSSFMLDKGAPIPQETAIQILSVALAGLTALYFIAHRNEVTPKSPSHPRAARVATAALLVIALVGGWGSSVLLDTHSRDIDEALGRMVRTLRFRDQVGFSKSARLGSIAAQQGKNSAATALRVFSPTPPGYLRGMAFEAYKNAAWTPAEMGKPLDPVRPEKGTPPLEKGQYAFDLRKAVTPLPAEVWTMEVHSTALVSDTAFTTLDTALVYASCDTLTASQYGTLRVPRTHEGTPYTTVDARPLPQFPLDESMRKRLLALPAGLDSRIVSLAREVTQGCATDAEKITAVRTHFTSNYEYKLGIQVPEDEEPLAYFLCERPAAHCEYFASGAAILLRLAGVPCRYVTGFLVGEKNPYGAYWVARNKDAHAWVEAYDREKGWVTVEATPGSGIPSGAASTFSQFTEYLRYQFQLLREAFLNGGILSLLGALVTLAGQALKSLILSPAGAVLAAGAILLALWRVLRKRGRRAGRRTDPKTAALLRLLTRMDRHVKKRGHIRKASETLHRFAARLAAAGLPKHADWYRTYAAIRYGQPCPQEDLQILAEEALDE